MATDRRATMRTACPTFFNFRQFPVFFRLLLAPLGRPLPGPREDPCPCSLSSSSSIPLCPAGDSRHLSNRRVCFHLSPSFSYTAGPARSLLCYPTNMDNYPTRRPRDTSNATSTQSINRDSNALRASVLDAALQLGFGTNKSLANMIFDVVDEDDEDVRSTLSSILFRFRECSPYTIRLILFFCHYLLQSTERCHTTDLLTWSDFRLDGYLRRSCVVVSLSLTTRLARPVTRLEISRTIIQWPLR